MCCRIKVNMFIVEEILMIFKWFIYCINVYCRCVVDISVCIYFYVVIVKGV